MTETGISTRFFYALPQRIRCVTIMETLQGTSTTFVKSNFLKEGGWLY